MTVLACVALCVQAFLVSLLVVVKARKTILNNDYMKENFAKLHAEAFPGQRPPLLGFPDAGSGVYANALPYKAWVTFNNAMRAHLNIVEQLHFLIPFIMVAGLIVPQITLYFAWLGVFSRVAYVIGYVVKGANARMFGAAFNLFPIYIVGFISIYVLGRNTLSGNWIAA